MKSCKFISWNLVKYFSFLLLRDSMLKINKACIFLILSHYIVNILLLLTLLFISSTTSSHSLVFGVPCNICLHGIHSLVVVIFSYFSTWLQIAMVCAIMFKDTKQKKLPHKETKNHINLWSNIFNHIIGYRNSIDVNILFKRLYLKNFLFPLECDG